MTDRLPGRHGLGFRPWMRLTRRSEFLRVLELKNKSVGSRLVVYAAARERAGLPTRLGITVSRRVGRAVVRNRVKRRVREAFRLDYDRIAPGHDVVVNARARAAEGNGTVLREDFRRCLLALGLWDTRDRPKRSSPSPDLSGEG